MADDSRRSGTPHVVGKVREEDVVTHHDVHLGTSVGGPFSVRTPIGPMGGDRGAVGDALRVKILNREMILKIVAENSFKPERSYLGSFATLVI